ncbi:MAG: 4Fe-4S dicluster domain-containing protein [Peptococcaceae bacterium]|nr:MAG: 4Fe-4S dicluster domain-containing protein [Peptococcaceae bacterium]
MKPVDEEPKARFVISINKERCRQCGICVRFCPKNVLAADGRGYIYAEQAGECIGCQACFFRCPDFALEVIDLDL